MFNRPLFIHRKERHDDDDEEEGRWGDEKKLSILQISAEKCVFILQVFFSRFQLEKSYDSSDDVAREGKMMTKKYVISH